MSFQIGCECGKMLNIPEHLAGKKVKCPGCQSIVVAKEPNEVPVSSPSIVKPEPNEPKIEKPAITERVKKVLSAVIGIFGTFFGKIKETAFGINVLSAIKNRFTFDGRSTRTELICFTIWTIVFPLVAVIVPFIAGFGVELPYGIGTVITVAIIILVCVEIIVCLLYCLIPIYALTVRRLHDLNWSGWWIFLMLVPFVGNAVLAIATLCMRGSVGGNRFGADPRGIVTEDERMNQIMQLGELKDKGIMSEEDFRQEKMKTLCSEGQLYASLYILHASQLVRFKAMLDAGALTQEEFISKKNTLLRANLSDA